jgi:mannosyltransferase OCH1-like enzyme
MIPRTIHQTWKTNSIPEKFKKYQQSWMKKNPDFQYKLWTDEDNDNLIKNHYPQYYDLYQSFDQKILKVDFSRFCMMHHCGGIYADLDFECLKSINELLDKNKIVFGLSRENLIEIAFIASEPKQQIWLDMLEYVSDEYQNRKSIKGKIVSTFFKDFAVLYITGPNAFTDFYNKNPQYHEIIHLLDYRYFYPKVWLDGEATKNFEDYKNYQITYPVTYGIHHFEDSWSDEISLKIMYYLFKYFRHQILPWFVTEIKTDRKKLRERI